MTQDAEFANLVVWVITIIILAAILLPQIFRILREYERGVIFRLGKLLAAKGPGLIILIPFIDRMVRVDLRVVTSNVPKQEIITKDNVPVTVDAITYFRVVDSEAAIIKVENYLEATSLFAQTTLRSVLGQAELDELLSERDKINQNIQEILDRQTDPWGIKVTSVEVKDVVLAENMKRAMAKQAETERERRAKIINAQGEFQAAKKMVQAGNMIAKEPVALQLRFLQTMSELGYENNTITFMPLPMELFRAFVKNNSGNFGTDDPNAPQGPEGPEGPVDPEEAPPNPMDPGSMDPGKMDTGSPEEDPGVEPPKRKAQPGESSKKSSGSGSKGSSGSSKK